MSNNATPTKLTKTQLTTLQSIPGAEAGLRDITDVQLEIDKLEDSKREINSQFKLYKGNADKVSELKTRSKEISAELKALLDTKKDVIQSLYDFLLIEESNPIATLPQRFSEPTQNIDNPTIARVIEASENDIERCNRYVNAHPLASSCHDFKWKEVFRRSFGHKGMYLIAEDQHNNIIGLLPLTWLNSRIFGSFCASVPFLNYGGPLADNETIREALLTKSVELAKKLKLSSIEYRTCSSGWQLPAKSNKASMILALPKSAEKLEQAVGSKVRAQYRLAEKHQPAIKFGRNELLDDFYYVFSRNMRDLGTPVYAKSFFANILTAFSEQARLVVVYLDNKPAAVAFLFGYKDMLEIPWASTLRKHNSKNINMWMYRKILGFAISNKYGYFDFGRSTIDAGTYKFKKQWGAKPVQHHWYYWLQDGESLPNLNPDNPKYKLAIAVWKKLPILITQLVGPHLVKYLP